MTATDCVFDRAELHPLVQAHLGQLMLVQQ
jgi:hypothetical protein